MPTRSSADIDRELGLEWYITDVPGTGGRLRTFLEDFIVEEITINGIVIWSTLSGRTIELEDSGSGWCWIAVEKRKIDTITVAFRIARSVEVSIREVTYGGLKDTVAIATQIFSVPSRARIDKLKNVEDDRVKILKIVRAGTPYTSQEMWGNRFTITVRDVERPELVDQCLKQVRERGLPNYYGYQRFGLQRPNTHIIGKLIIMRRFEDALVEFLGRPWTEETEEVSKARELFLKGEYCKALEVLPRSMRFLPERRVLEHLCRNPKDVIGAFRKLPPDLLRLYVESYQSYLYNRSLSMRIERALPIREAVEGDYVAVLDHRGLPTRHIIYVSSRSILDKVNQKIREGKMCLMLPVPGYSTRIMPGPQGEILRSVIKDEGISLDMFRLHEMPEADCPGTFRQASITPLIESLEKNEKIIRITFRLARGSYATVLLREIIKPQDPRSSGF
ncbi:MAG: tRNA pseudouridine(13) synthase TruD [Crenarchaeota archaeon]|nr:tRNA pseudouridine(13) synthase TruD [Thermoproteota archaeon]